jgi:type IV secretory pathway TraG/TraD family ATPase VirD4
VAALAGLPAGAALALIFAAIALRGVWRLARGLAERERQSTERLRAGRMITIGHDAQGLPVEVPERALAAHALILGATGAGKTTTMLTLLSDQIEQGRGVVAIDLKGSPAFAAQLRAAAEAAGRPFRVWQPDGQTHWNPLANGNATELKDKLLDTERFTEPHYQRAAERYLQLAITTAQAAEPGQPLTLARVVGLMNPARLAALARRAGPERQAHVQEYVAGLTSDQVSAIRGLGSRLAVLTESHAGPLLEPGAPGDTLDLRAALDGGEVVLFSLNSSTYGGLAAMLGTLAVADLTAASGARLAAWPDQHSQALVAIDEFSALRSDNLLSLLVRGREAGIGVMLATQELADLNRAGAGVRDQVLGDTALKIAHRQDVPESARAVAELSGTIETWERSYQHRPGARGARHLTSASDRLVRRTRIDAERISSLATGEAAVMTKAPYTSSQLARIRRRTRERKGGREPPLSR